LALLKTNEEVALYPKFAPKMLFLSRMCHNLQHAPRGCQQARNSNAIW